MWPKISWKYIEGNCKCLVIHRYDYVSALKYFSHMFHIEVFLPSWRCQLIFLPPQSSLNTNKVGFEPSTPLKKENKKTPPSSDDNAMQHSGLITYTKSRKIFVSRKRKQLEKVGTWNLLWVNHKMFSYFSSEIKAFFSSRNGTTCSSNVIVLTVAFAYFFPPNFFINSHKMMHTQKHWLQRPLNCHIINP